nr:Nif11-like leader peptide family natural product precursor [Schwartzia sp. (in: firmicutes)]
MQQALKCKDADELLTLAKGQGYEMTREEAEAYMAEINDFQLDNEAMKAVAGGVNNCYMVDGCAFKCGTLKDC